MNTLYPIVLHSMRKFFILCLMAVLCTSVQSWAVVRYVNAGVSGGTGDGLSWPNAYNNLQSALTAAQSGDEIWVAAGTYKPTSGTDRDVSFVMKNGVAMYGGFIGNEITLTARNISANPTILSGDIGTANNASDNVHHVVVAANVTTRLDGFTITGGNANGVTNTSITVNGQSIPRNYGGGICTSQGTNTLVNNTLSGNSTGYGGGGIYLYQGSNTLTNNTLSGNSASDVGGGISIYEGSNTLINNRLLGNSTLGFGGGGGGVHILFGTNILTNNSLSGNSAYKGGGIFMAAAGIPNGSNNTLTNNILSGNSASSQGGGIYASSNSLNTLTNNTLSGNSAPSGSGIFAALSTNTLTNNIIWGTNSEIVNNALAFTVTYSIVQGGFTGTGNLNADPLFVDAADADGADNVFGTADDGLRLQRCSPAIDAGTSTGAPTTDILGNARVDAIAGGNIVDMGAYEYQSIFQEINLQGGSPLTNILDGDNTPTTVKGTDFGNVNVSSNVAKTFTIENTGGTTLNISSFASTNALFVVSGLTLPATITAGSSATFTVTFTPTATGAQNATITVNNDDCNEAVYDFAVTGAGAPPDYSITTTGNAVVITDVSGNGETLDVSESSGNIRFVVTPTTRTYSIDGGPTTAFTTPADVALATKTSITINTAVGNDIINVAALGTNIPNLTINGGTGDDAVNFNGDITFAANANLDVDLQNNATPGVDQVTLAASANLILSGTGAAVVKVSRNVLLNSSSSIETANGNLTVEANQQATPTSGLFNAVDIFGTLQASGSGAVTVKGKGGITSSSNSFGIYVQTNGKIQGGTSGAVTVVGQGGGGGNNCYGVLVDQSAQITSSGGAVSVTGTGRGTGGGIANYGVLLGGGVISNAGTGSGATVTVVGQGGNTSGTGRANIGVYLISSSQITSSGGAVSVTGTGGGAGASTDNHGVYLFSGVITSTGSGATVTVVGQGGNTSANTNHGVYVNGSSSKITSSSGAVSVTGTGGGTSADILTQSGGMITSTSTTAGITLNSTTNGTWPNAVTDVSTTATQKTTFGAGSKLNIDIDGTTANTEYQQLGVVGMIDLNGATLTFTGSTYTPVLGNTFTIVDNDGTDAVIGTFNGLAEGATIANFLGSGLNATITYTGGTGNDVVIAVCPIFTPTVSIAALPAGAICAATSVTFTATPTNTGGGTVNYDFKIGGSSVQSGTSNTFTSTTLANGNAVTCDITVTGGTCLTTTTASSNTITMTVNPNLTPTVSIAALPAGAICAGTSVAFTATPTNTGGGTINYDFKIGGSSVQSGTSNTYTTTSLANGNAVTCDITVTGGTCLTTTTASSNTITMSVNPNLTPTVSIAALRHLCGTQRGNGGGTMAILHSPMAMQSPVTSPSRAVLV